MFSIYIFFNFKFKYLYIFIWDEKWKRNMINKLFIYYSIISGKVSLRCCCWFFGLWLLYFILLLFHSWWIVWFNWNSSLIVDRFMLFLSLYYLYMKQKFHPQIVSHISMVRIFFGAIKATKIKRLVCHGERMSFKLI